MARSLWDGRGALYFKWDESPDATRPGDVLYNSGSDKKWRRPCQLEGYLFFLLANTRVAKWITLAGQGGRIAPEYEDEMNRCRETN